MSDPARAGLPSAWGGQRQWRVLAIGFGVGLDFLRTWAAWRADPQRPALLHYAATEASPVAAHALAPGGLHRALEPLARELANRWWGLVPGIHRLVFDDGRVLLTLCVGETRAMLSELAFSADAVDGTAAADLPSAKAVARLCRRGTTLAAALVPLAARREWQQCGFVFDDDAKPGARFDPAWDLRRPAAAQQEPSTALVIGGGLAGAAVACSLARRGWQVEVLDAAPHPAGGASALPAGLLAPHTSPDDNLLSRLARSGVRLTLQEAALRLRQGQDWAPSGVLRRRGASDRRPADLGPRGEPWQRWHDGDETATWHTAAAWIRPARLVQAWLAQPGIRWQGSTRVQALDHAGGQWRALDAAGRPLAQARLVVVAAALGSASLADLPALHAVRGQVSWDLLGDGPPLAVSPVNGNGHVLPDVQLEQGRAWLTGSTYAHGDDDPLPRAADQLQNLERLRTLLPDSVDRVAVAFASGSVQAWSGVRCASADRRPLLGERAPGLWVSTAMGSRGLTFALLCAELLAARLHAEPLPLPVRLAAALDACRHGGVTPWRSAP